MEESRGWLRLIEDDVLLVVRFYRVILFNFFLTAAFVTNSKLRDVD